MEERYYAHIRKHIVMGMILVPVIPFLMIIGVGYHYFSSSIKDNTISSMERIVRDHRDMVASFLKERRADLSFILAEYDVDELKQPETLQRVFDHLHKKSSTFVDLGVVDSQGLHVAYVGPYTLGGRVYKDTTWFKEVMAKGRYQSDVFLGFRNIPHFVIALSSTHNGQPWFIRATIDTYRFSEIVEAIRIGQTGEAYIINQDGVLQTQRWSGGRFLDKDSEDVTYPDEPGAIRTYVKEDGRGMTYVYATTWIIPNKWLLVVRQNKDDAFAAFNQAAWLTLLIAVISAMGMVCLAIILSGRIEHRLRMTDKEKESLQNQLVRATRLAELGEMAAGFAHEINNPLQVMKSDHAYIELILEDMKKKGDMKEGEESHEIDQALIQIQNQIGRCAKITRSILRFGRQGKPEYKDMDLNTFLPEVVGMIEKKAAVNGIEIIRELPDKPLTIYADPGHIQQIVLNLFNNAIYAIVERHGSEGGMLGISGSHTPDGLVEIRVQDNGGGISPENQAKIFSPFFTTKPVGKGTGLGLSVCFGLVENMGGTMEVSSRQGEGTTFTLRFPSR
ncbi:MAG: two-component sensor histidine kinase [Deltaproteobacteria bacterium]|nr:MAG: two-component sensor histidine kinase [Deltaproteobacteria bacterium]